MRIIIQTNDIINNSEYKQTLNDAIVNKNISNPHGTVLSTGAVC